LENVLIENYTFFYCSFNGVSDPSGIGPVHLPAQNLWVKGVYG